MQGPYLVPISVPGTVKSRPPFYSTRRLDVTRTLLYGAKGNGALLHGAQQPATGELMWQLPSEPQQHSMPNAVAVCTQSAVQPHLKVGAGVGGLGGGSGGAGPFALTG